MPNLSSLIQPNNIVTSENEVTLTNKTIDSPVITVNGQSGNPRQPLVFDDNGFVTFGNGDSFLIPAGGTAGRPAAPVTGELRYNTDTSGLEQYNGTSWVSVVPDDIDLNTLSINGTQVIDSSGNINTGSVSINGTQVVDSSGNIDTGSVSINGTQVVDSSGNIDTGSVSIGGSEVVNANRELKNITNADNIIKQPTNELPSNGATDIGGSSTSLTLSASAYNDLFGGQASATFQVSDASDFSNLVVNETISGSSVNSYTISGIFAVFTESTQYYFRVKYADINSNESLFSDATTFMTAASFVSVDQPTVTSPSDGAVVVYESPTITSSSFTVNIQSDTHASTDWQIASDSSFNTIVVQSLNDTSNLVSWTVPEGNLSTSTTYYIRVRHTGTNLGDSEWSNAVSFTTASEFIPAGWPVAIGTAYEGGYFAGQIDQGGTIYNLVVAPKSTGEDGSKAWANGTADGSTTGADSDIDGPSNTAILVSGYSSTDTEAAHFCDGLTIGGYSDWYMPAKNELEVLYYWLKPTTESNDTFSGANPNAVSPEPINTNYSSSDPSQTSVTIFQEGNSEAFSAGFYWSSTETDNIDKIYAWGQYFTDGDEFAPNRYSGNLVRAVRRVAV